MKCPNCGNEMVQSRAGWLCMSCGHIERRELPAPPSITVGRESHDQLLAAAEAESKANAADDAAEPKDPVATVVAGDAPATSPAASTTPPPDSTAAPSGSGQSDDTAMPSPAAPTPDDLNAVEKAVEAAEHTLGATKATAESDEEAEVVSDEKPSDSEPSGAVVDAAVKNEKSYDNEALKPAAPNSDGNDAIEPTDHKATDRDADNDKGKDDPKDDVDDAPSSGKKVDDEADADDTESKIDAPDVSNKATDKVGSQEPVQDTAVAAEESPTFQLPVNKHRLSAANANVPASEEADAKSDGPNDRPDDEAEKRDDKDDEHDKREGHQDPDSHPDNADDIEDKLAAANAPDSSDKVDEDESETDAKEPETSDEAKGEDVKPEPEADKYDASNDGDTEEQPEKPSKDNPAPVGDEVKDETHAAADDKDTPSDDGAATDGDKADEDEHDASNSKDAEGTPSPADPVEEDVDPEDKKPESLEQVEKDIETDDDDAQADEAAVEHGDDKPEHDDKEPEAPEEPKPESTGEAAKVAAPVPIYDTAHTTSSTSQSSSEDALVPANAPTAAATSAPSGSPPQAAPVPAQLSSVSAHTHAAPWGAKKTAGLVVGLVVIAIVASFVYLFDFSASGALGGYFQKLYTSRTLTYDATVSYVNGDNSLAFNSAGMVDISNHSQPKYSARLTGQVSADAGVVSSNSKATSGSLAGTVDAIGQTLYFNQSTSNTINQLFPITVTDNKWFKYSMDSNTAQCLNPAHNPILGGGLGSATPISSATLVGIETLDSAKMLHYHGTVDASKLVAALQKANQSVPSNCRFNLASGDIANLGITFDLWRGMSHDRLVVYSNNLKTGAHLELTLDTSGYNQAVSIDQPASATTVTTNPKVVLGASTVAPLPVVRPALDAAADNAARQSALAQYAAAYAASAQNGYLFTNPPQVSVAATDPVSHQPYTVQTTAPTALGQIEYAAGHQCSGASITPGKLATRHVALYTLLQGLTAPACLEVK